MYLPNNFKISYQKSLDYQKKKISPVTTDYQEYFGKKFPFLKKYLSIAFRNFRDKLIFLNDHLNFLLIKNFPYEGNYNYNDENTLFNLKMFTLMEMEKNVMVNTYEKDGQVFAYIYRKNNQKNVAKIDYFRKYYNEKLSKKVWSSYYLSGYDKKYLFNVFLNQMILDLPDFWKYKGYSNLDKKDINKMIGIYFEKGIKKQLPQLQKEYDKFYEETVKEIEKESKTKKYKEFEKNFIKNSKKFVYPMKEVFGPSHEIQYECFKHKIDEFKKSIQKKMMLNNK